MIFYRLFNLFTKSVDFTGLAKIASLSLYGLENSTSNSSSKADTRIVKGATVPSAFVTAEIESNAMSSSSKSRLVKLGLQFRVCFLDSLWLWNNLGSDSRFSSSSFSTISHLNDLRISSKISLLFLITSPLFLAL